MNLREDSKIFNCDLWHVEYLTEDGGRICRLQYSGIDLLMREPRTFIKPDNDFGLYETRPVYGYDDCFPTVDSCIYPGGKWIIPDHGELCWLPWKITEKKDQLQCSVSSKALPLTFQRNLRFEKNELTWEFRVENLGSDTIYFQHVMHSLMRLTEISDIELPEFNELYDEINDSSKLYLSADKLKTLLLTKKTGSVSMFILRDLKENHFTIEIKSRLKLTVEFPKSLFSSLGIWWNKSGYPNEKNLQRDECAFEPIPGNNSMLTNAFNEGLALKVEPEASFSWSIKWILFEKGVTAGGDI